MNGRRALIIVHEPAGTSALVGEGLSRRGFEVIEHLVTADIEAIRSKLSAPVTSMPSHRLSASAGSSTAAMAGQVSGSTGWEAPYPGMSQATHRTRQRFTLPGWSEHL